MKGKHIGPNTAEEMVKAWDAGEIVWTIEMGGMGPGYEQAIQTLVIELLRSAGPVPEKEAERKAWGDDVVSKHDESLGGMSGAQVGAAKTLAYHVLKKGMHAVLDEFDEDRHTMISIHWPRAAK